MGKNAAIIVLVILSVIVLVGAYMLLASPKSTGQQTRANGDCPGGCMEETLAFVAGLQPNIKR